MSYHDFARIYTHLSICLPQPQHLEGEHAGEPWLETAFTGEWRAGETAGGRDSLDNPQFMVVVPSGGAELAVALMQKRRRQLRDELGIHSALHIGISLFNYGGERKGRLEEGEGLDLIGGRDFHPDRTVTLQKILVSGVYLVIPSTYYTRQEGGFYLRFKYMNPSLVIKELK